MELRDKIDENSWGSAYKIALTTLRGKNANTPTTPELMTNRVKGLFPQQSSFQHTIVLLSIVTANEVLNAANKVDVNKTPGLNGITKKNKTIYFL